MAEEENDDSNDSNDSNDSLGITRFKIVFIGDSLVGKTSIIDRIIANSFKNSNEETIVQIFFQKNFIQREKN